ncbi:hypothetical protein WDW89_09375 [Deltaproteobacteria bacterium TL4]
MLPKEVFYFFIIPWIILIASVPGLVLTTLVAGMGAQLLNFFEKDQTKERQ